MYLLSLHWWLITLLCWPLLLWQGKRVRKLALHLPEAAGPRSGVSGDAQLPPLRLLICGDSAAAGVGVTLQDDALSGQLVSLLAPHYRVQWQLEAQTGLDSAGVRVVAWTRLDGQWMRWQSGPLQHRDDLARAWQRAALWGQALAPDAAQRSEADSAVAVAAIDQWQIFYHRGETWGNPLSSVGNESAGTPPTTTQVSLPNGVRLVLTLSTGQAMQGTLTRDWVRPTLEAGQ